MGGSLMTYIRLSRDHIPDNIKEAALDVQVQMLSEEFVI